MKIVEYEKSLQWVGTLVCPECSKVTHAWRSSGMSMCFPHFYCNKCSNVIHMIKFQGQIYNNGGTQEILDAIVKELPSCPCGGKFTPNSSPKCPKCGFEFKHKNNEIKRLTDPCMIIMDGSCNIKENGKSYRVKIVD